jgi:hypothetical protein
MQVIIILNRAEERMGEKMRVMRVLMAGAIFTGMAIGLAQAQIPPPGPKPGTEMKPGMPAPMRSMPRTGMQQMQERLIEIAIKNADLDAKKTALAKQVMKAKMNAELKLNDARTNLRLVSGIGTKSTAVQQRNAVASFRKALAAYRAKVAAEDNKLYAVLTSEEQARCLFMGILDNGQSIRPGFRMGSRGMRPGMGSDGAMGSPQGMPFPSVNKSPVKK